tara:strand:+ start:583 stop:807 length:225 start_codon:yes stop_codon:yes gene_type:complete
MNLIYCLDHMEISESNFTLKPIDKANDSLDSIKNKIDKINVDIVCMKADLEFIKQQLLIKKDKPTPVKGGWIFS